MKQYLLILFLGLPLILGSGFVKADEATVLAEQALRQEINYKIKLQKVIAEISEMYEEKINNSLPIEDFSDKQLDNIIRDITINDMGQLLDLYSDTHQWPTTLLGKLKKSIERESIIRALKKIKPYLIGSFKRRGIVPTILNILNKILQRTLPPILVFHGFSPLIAGIAEIIPYKSGLELLWKRGRHRYVEFRRGMLYKDKEKLIEYKVMMKKVYDELGLGTTRSSVIALRKGEHSIESATIEIPSIVRRTLRKILKMKGWGDKLNFERLYKLCIENGIEIEMANEIKQSTNLKYEYKAIYLLNSIFENVSEGSENDKFITKLNVSDAFNQMPKIKGLKSILKWADVMRNSKNVDDIKKSFDLIPEGFDALYIAKIWEDLLIDEISTVPGINIVEARRLHYDFMKVRSTIIQGDLKWNKEVKSSFLNYIDSATQMKGRNCVDYLLYFL